MTTSSSYLPKDLIQLAFQLNVMGGPVPPIAPTIDLSSPQELNFEFDALSDDVLGEGPGISLQELEEVQSRTPLVNVTGPSGTMETSFEVSGSPIEFDFKVPHFLSNLGGKEVFSLAEKIFLLFTNDLAKHARDSNLSSANELFKGILTNITKVLVYFT